MLEFHVKNLKRHIEGRGKKKVLNVNKFGDRLFVDISMTYVSNAVKSGIITEEQLLKKLGV